MRPEWQRAALRRAIVPAVLMIAGLALVLAAGGTVETIGYVLLGLGGILAVALVFLEIGFSEDRERSRGRS
jgi:hypothetical protein